MQELLVAIDTAVKEAEWSPEHQDQLAIRDEYVFRKRFGFVVNRLQREKIIALKHEADLTDKEVRILRKSSSIVFRNERLQVMAPTALAIWGYILIAFLMLMMFLSLLAAELAEHVGMKEVVVLIVVNALLLFGMNASNDVYIWPQRIRKRVEQRRMIRGRQDL